jgi:hypothetical protein
MGIRKEINLEERSYLQAQRTKSHVHLILHGASMYCKNNLKERESRVGVLHFRKIINQVEVAC